MRGRAKFVIKKRIDVEQKIQDLLVAIAEEQRYVKRQKLEKQFGARLAQMKERLLTLPAQKNNLALVLQQEKQLHAI